MNKYKLDSTSLLQSFNPLVRVDYIYMLYMFRKLSLVSLISYIVHSFNNKLSFGKKRAQNKLNSNSNKYINLYKSIYIVCVCIYQA